MEDRSALLLPAIRRPQLAVDTGASDYQILQVYARTQNISLGTDIIIRSAGYPIARAEFEAGRVDAAVLVEPHVALAKAKDPATHVIWDGNQAWASITGFPKGWYLSLIAREGLGRDTPEAISRIIDMYGDVEKLIKDNPDLVDAIVTTALKLPKGVIKDAAVNGRIELKVRPAWLAPDKDNLWQMFSLAVITGYISKIPDQGIIYTPKPAP